MTFCETKLCVLLLKKAHGGASDVGYSRAATYVLVVDNNSSFRKSRTTTEERFSVAANIGIDLKHEFQKYPISVPSNQVRANHSSHWSDFGLATATLHTNELETNACLFVISHWHATYRADMSTMYAK
jgi:hypothetical protein